MVYIIIDLITRNILGLNTATFLYYLNYIKIKEFLISMLFLYLLNENILLITIISIMYIVNIMLYKYLNKYLIFELAIFTFFYFILFKIDEFYVLNLFLVIVLKYTKYNHTRWLDEPKTYKRIPKKNIFIIIFFFLCLAIDNNFINQDVILKNSVDFSYIRSKTRILFGNFLNKKELYVTSEKIKYKDITKYQDGFKLTVDRNYVIKSLKSGVVIYIGNIEGFGKTVTVNCDDGTNISYSNLENISVKPYDYIDKNKILGSTIDNNLYLTFEKNKEYLSYEEYL